MVIWILDCSNGCVTKVNLSKEREEDLNKFLGEVEEYGGDLHEWLAIHDDEFGINLNCSSYMMTENGSIYEIDF